MAAGSPKGCCGHGVVVEDDVVVGVDVDVGVGKGTVVKLLQEKYQEERRKLYLSVSCTTRAPREGEREGVHYYFISEEEFNNKIKHNDFLEYNQYGTGKYYGTPKDKVIDYLQKGYDVILEIDVNGYKQVCQNYKDCIGVFIMPPTIEDLERRLRDRKTETEEAIQKRLQTAQAELLTKDLYDYVIVNENGKSDEACKKLYNIMTK